MPSTLTLYDFTHIHTSETVNQKHVTFININSPLQTVFQVKLEFCNSFCNCNILENHISRFVDK